MSSTDEPDIYDEKFIKEYEPDRVFLALLLSFAFPIVGIFLARKSAKEAEAAGRDPHDAHIAVLISLIMLVIWTISGTYIIYKVAQGFDPPEVTIESVNQREVEDPQPVTIEVPANIDHKLAWEFLVSEAGYRANDIFIRFQPNQTAFENNSLATNHLDAIAEYAGKYQDIRFAVTGFTNTVDTSDFAQQLSISRAQKIVNELVNRGVGSDRFENTGQGSFELYFGYASSDEANRTVTVTLLELAPTEGR